MYGYDNPDNLIGVRFSQLFDTSKNSNLDNLRTLLINNYFIQNIETIEIGKNCVPKYFLNDVFGIVEQGHLIRVWGSQIDITDDKLRESILKKLSPEQFKILKFTIEGKSMKEIAAELGISLKKVELSRNHIKSTIGVKSLAQLIAVAVQFDINNFVY